MTKEQQIKIFDAFVEKMRLTLISKGDDYSNGDRLSNFKFTASLTNLTPEKSCLNLIAVKVARLNNLLEGKVPNNESIEDSILDLTNYCVLLKMIVSESQNGESHFDSR